MKEFNTTGLCVPSRHYMVDITGRVLKIKQLIDKDKYFTINRPRQYGKTTILNAVYNAINDVYNIIDLSFEGVGDSYFADEKSFCTGIYKDICSSLSISDDVPVNSFTLLSTRISEICRTIDKPVVLIIDEVDKNSDNQIFLNFLGMLRSKYLNGLKGRDYTFKSVILAGVYNIKNLKLKLRPEAEIKYNSPWNIASDFNIDMSFSSQDIATMLTEYESDCQTGMDINAVSDVIFENTSGYPYLVSRLCQIIQDNEYEWNSEGVIQAVKTILNEENTLFDDIFKNIMNNRDFSDLVERIILSGDEIPFTPYNKEIQLGTTFGILCNNQGIVKISNRIFETLLYNIFISQNSRSELSCERNQFINANGTLNVEKVLIKFQELMKCEYRSEDGNFLERQGRLLFLCFLKPIINGTGSYFVESATRSNTRMDIVIAYGGEEHIIELKIWHGECKHNDAYNQLLGYMKNRSQKKGYLLSFSFGKNKIQTAEWKEFNDGDRILDVII